MEVIPAIDLRGGRCVRLHQGDYARETVFDGDPIEIGLKWVAAGATRVHVVDLDGARDGVRANAAVVSDLVKRLGVPVQVGGGVRDASGAAELVDSGADRVIFGTAAVEAPHEIEAAVQRLGSSRVMVGVDARDGVVATRGWKTSSGLTARNLIDEMAGRGVRRFMYTDIAKDGTLSHPNFGSITELISGVRYPIVVAGGITTSRDIITLAELGAEAAVTGLAIYSGRLDLRQAISDLRATGY